MSNQSNPTSDMGIIEKILISFYDDISGTVEGLMAQYHRLEIERAIDSILTWHEQSCQKRAREELEKLLSKCYRVKVGEFMDIPVVNESTIKMALAQLSNPIEKETE